MNNLKERIKCTHEIAVEAEKSITAYITEAEEQMHNISPKKTYDPIDDSSPLYDARYAVRKIVAATNLADSTAPEEVDRAEIVELSRKASDILDKRISDFEKYASTMKNNIDFLRDAKKRLAEIPFNIYTAKECEELAN